LRLGVLSAPVSNTSLNDDFDTAASSISWRQPFRCCASLIGIDGGGAQRLVLIA
jgi:hypothetical protein